MGLWRRGRIALLIGVLQWRDTGSSGKIGWAGEEEGLIELYTKERLEFMELYLRTGDKAVESLWVRIRRQTITGDAVPGVCYRPPDREEEVDEAFFRQSEKASQLQALVLVRDFNHPSICWKDNTAGQEQSRRLLERTEDYFLMRVISEPTRENALLDLLLTNNWLMV